MCRPAGSPPRARAIRERCGIGEVPLICTPVRIAEGVRVRTVAPKLGQHNAEIFGRLGLSEAELKELLDKRVL
jgi:crotonobetainyl-CoA:carnitine CoA-transferase CaiB-like acyl-CoA transferase